MCNVTCHQFTVESSLVIVLAPYSVRSSGSLSVFKQLRTDPSLNPTLTLTCCHLCVVGLGEGKVLKLSLPYCFSFASPVLIFLILVFFFSHLFFCQINGKDMKIARHEDAVGMLTGGLSYVTLVVVRERVINKRMLPLSKLQDQSILNKRLPTKVS